MSKIGIVLLAFGPVLVFTRIVLAQQVDTSSVRSVLRSDIQEVQAQKEEMKENSQVSRQEEQDLRSQIQQAIQSGDQQKTQEIIARLKAMRQENMQQRQQDMQDLKQERQDLRTDMKEAGIPPRNPLGYNPPGEGSANPPGYNPPGRGPSGEGRERRR
ncbi:MAG: hypothetical protein ABH882_02855 [Candidatus Omnitrophota bacterium]|nr:hypothetical protein [Candidatus Omnitrophota bacterium]MBU1929764.1 hypothetical protein [Candidatus Omnitrophota bacterium]MBU2035234.1 hypothetical protein [Candidatus Omnitrophota bacterium]MBU2222059.1 hypothetical protein [Candidatus Omnitrophota bacterium]